MRVLLLLLLLMQGETFEDLAGRAGAALDSDPAQAAVLFRRALALRPSWAEGWLYLGASLHQVSRHAEAVDAFRKGIRLAPRMGTAWAFLGLSEAELDNTEQALADIRKGEELGLGDNRAFEVTVRVAAARLLIRQSAFDDALTQLQPVSRFNQEFPEVSLTMGLCALGLPQAVAELTPARRAVVELAGKAAWAAASQHPEEARKGYQQLLERYPNERGVHYAHGLFLMESDPMAALAEFQAEVKLDASHWPSLIVIAALEARRGSPENSIAPVQSALKLAPANYRWLCHSELGRAYLTLDDVDKAVTEFEIAASLMPDNAQVHFYLAQAYRRAGRTADAAKETAEFQRLKAIEDPLGMPTK